MKNIDDIVDQAEQEQNTVTELAKDTVQWFTSDQRIGNAYPIEEATQELSKYLDVGYHEASRAISSVVGDIVDPVQLITLSDGKYVGVFEYNIYSNSGAYGYIHYDDRLGKLRRVVCAKCVQDHILDENVTHATQGMGTSDDESSWTDLVNKIENHYGNSHQTQPEEIEPGAALVSGTTISGNSVFHSGNESGISHNNISGGTTGNPHADSLSTSYTAPVQDVNGNTGSVTISVPVDSVNGETGAVTLSAADVNALSDTYSAPVQSVNSQTGDVTISTGSAIGGSVTNYSDLPFNLSERQLYYVSSEQDVVVQTDANLDIWKSVSDFVTVASIIPDGAIDTYEPYLYEDQSKTITDYYSNNTSKYTRQTDTVLEDTTTLQSDSSGSNFGIISNSGLPNYPSVGDDVEFLIRSESSGRRVFSFFASGTGVNGGLPNEGYVLEANFGRGWGDYERNNGSGGPGGVYDGSASSGTTYRCVMNYDGSDVSSSVTRVSDGTSVFNNTFTPSPDFGSVDGIYIGQPDSGITYYDGIQIV